MRRGAGGRQPGAAKKPPGIYHNNRKSSNLSCPLLATTPRQNHDSALFGEGIFSYAAVEHCCSSSHILLVDLAGPRSPYFGPLPTLSPVVVHPSFTATTLTPPKARFLTIQSVVELAFNLYHIV